MPPPWRQRPSLRPSAQPTAAPAPPKNAGAAGGSAHNATIKVEEKK